MEHVARNGTKCMCIFGVKTGEQRIVTMTRALVCVSSERDHLCDWQLWEISWRPRLSWCTRDYSAASCCMGGMCHLDPIVFGTQCCAQHFSWSLASPHNGSIRRHTPSHFAFHDQTQHPVPELNTNRLRIYCVDPLVFSTR